MSQNKQKSDSSSKPAPHILSEQGFPHVMKQPHDIIKAQLAEKNELLRQHEERHKNQVKENSRLSATKTRLHMKLLQKEEMAEVALEKVNAFEKDVRKLRETVNDAIDDQANIVEISANTRKEYNEVAKIYLAKKKKIQEYEASLNSKVMELDKKIKEALETLEAKKQSVESQKEVFASKEQYLMDIRNKRQNLEKKANDANQEELMQGLEQLNLVFEEKNDKIAELKNSKSAAIENIRDILNEQNEVQEKLLEKEEELIEVTSSVEILASRRDYEKNLLEQLMLQKFKREQQRADTLNRSTAAQLNNKLESNESLAKMIEETVFNLEQNMIEMKNVEQAKADKLKVVQGAKEKANNTLINRQKLESEKKQLILQLETLRQEKKLEDEKRSEEKIACEKKLSKERNRLALLGGHNLAPPIIDSDDAMSSISSSLDRPDLKVEKFNLGDSIGSSTAISPSSAKKPKMDT